MGLVEAPPVGETPYNEEVNLAIRDFCIRGLAEAVPQFMNRDKAADLVVEWFPSDRLALASLYKQIAGNLAPLSA